MQTHRIGRQTIHLAVSRRADAFAVQAEMGRQFWAAAAPALERLFDRLASPDQLVELDLLDLNLGRFSEQEIESGAFVGRLVGLVEAAILEKTSQKTTAENSKKPLAEGFFDRWIFFLENGWLPFHQSPPSVEIWEEAVLKILAANSWAVVRLRVLMQKNEAARRRLARQFDPVFLKKMIVVVVARSVEKWMNLLDSLRFSLKIGRKTSASPFSERFLETVFLETLFEKTMVEEDWSGEAENLLAAFFSKKEMAVSRSFFEKTAAENAARLPVLTAFFSKKMESSEVENDVFEKENLPRLEIKTDLDFSKKEATATEIFVRQAGIVLLHPFLPRFFEKMGLKNDAPTEPTDWFRDRAAQEKAVALLDFLAFAKAERSLESELSLPKMLCGLPLNWPLDRREFLTKKEKREAEKLLRAVVEHWGALGKASPDGLREGFLQRDGKLWKSANSTWQLQVERRTLDLLLDRLPYGIGLVKLSWMPDFLQVNWI